MKCNERYFIIITMLCQIFLFTNNVLGQSDTANQTANINSSNGKEASSPEMKKWEKFGNEQNWDSAIFYAVKMELIAKKDFGDTSVAHAVILCHYLGYTYAIIGNYVMASETLKRGINILKILKQTKNERYTEAVFYIAMVSRSLGDDNEAEIYLHESLELNANQKNTRSYIQSIINLAGIYIDRGDYVKAEYLNTDMKVVVDTLPPSQFIHYMQASIYNNLAVIYYQTGNLQKAIVNFEKACEVELVARKEGNSREEYLTMLLNLAETLALNGQFDSAMKKCKQVEDSLSNENQNVIYAKLLADKALICQQQNKFKEALYLYGCYNNVVDSLALKPDTHVGNLINLGLIYNKVKQYDRADSLFRALISNLNYARLQFSYYMLQSVEGLCSNLIDQKKFDEAKDSLILLIRLSFKAMDNNFGSMSAAEQLKYRKDIDKVFDLLYTCIYNININKKDFLLAVFEFEMRRKNLVLNNEKENLRRVRSSSDKNAVKVYNAWLNTRQMLAKQYSLSFDQRFLNVDSLEDVSEKLEKTLKFNGFVPFAKEIQTKIPIYGPGTASIQFVRFNCKTIAKKTDADLYAAFIIKKDDSIPVFINLCNESSLLRMMKDKKGEWINEAQLTGNIYGRGEAANELYRLIWKPIQSYLAGVSYINYTTEGLLNDIAFNSIFDKNDFLMNRYKFRRFSSLLEVESEISIQKMPQNVSIWGNMDYKESVYLNENAVKYNDFDTSKRQTISYIPSNIKTPTQTKSISKKPLQPFNLIELIEIKKIFNDSKVNYTFYENANATEENFKMQAATTKGVLHISTHGFYTPANRNKEKDFLPGDYIAGVTNPLFRCGLAFSGANYYWMKGISKDNHDDGILTGYEISQLDLSNVDLVVLSACETALGDITDNEGDIGLQTAFKVAGVKRMIVSLWEVPVKQTSELFSLFYKNWLQGKSLSSALQEAQKTMQKKDYPPYYWAGFVLIE